MMRQLDIFQGGELPQAPEISDAARRVLAQLGDNFAWWCRHGNRDMCEAVLRRRRVRGSEARDAVDALSQEDPC